MKTKAKLDTRVIVVDDYNFRPMRFEDGQFVFVSPLKTNTTRNTGEARTVSVYSRGTALQLIQINNENRKKWNMSTGGFRLMLAELRK